VAPELTRALNASFEDRLGQAVEGDSLEEVVASVAGRASVNSLVVSLPDPTLGRPARYFDQALDALRRGARHYGYDQLGFRLPAADDVEAREEPPGTLEPYFIIFGRPSALLVCLIVLESPVQGPRSGDWPRALSLALTTQESGETLRLLAPFFSGGAHALGTELERFQRDRTERPLHFDVISGTATQKSIGEQIERAPDASFRRTTPNDDDVLRFLLKELAERHGAWRHHWLGPPKVAVLSEFDTAFGSGVAQDGSTRGGSALAQPPAFTPFRYPSAISEVRHVRRLQEKRLGVENGDDPLSLRRTLQLDVELTPTSRDVPALLSQVTPFERELELGEQLTRICRERYDYLVLTATDPLDLVFLAEEARKYCPGLTLIALGAEKIFRHPDVRPALDGLLVVGSYPLLFEIPPWGSSTERPFSSHVSEGFYNAWLTLLGEAHPGTPPPLVDYPGPALLSSCRSATSQAVWLTALAGGTFWPLRSGCIESEDAVRRELASSSDETAPAAGELRARVNGAVRAAGLLVVVWALAQVIWMRRRELRDLRRDALGARYRLGANLTLFLLLLLLTPAMFHAHRERGMAPWLGIAHLFSVPIVLGLLGALGAHVFRDARALVDQQNLLARAAWRRKQLPTTLSAVTLLAFAALFLLKSLAWIYQDTSLSPLERELALTRTYSPIGMSPVAPIAYLALAYYLWSFIGLCRVRALVRYSDMAPLPLRGDAPIEGAPSTSGSSLTPALGDVASNLRGAWSGSRWHYEVLGACLAAVPGAYFCLRVRPTWETPAYDWLLKLGLIVLYGLVVVASVHFLTLVSLLRRFLRQLAALPMVASYDRVALKMKSSFGIQFGVRVPAFEELQLSGYSATLLQVLMAAELFRGAASAQPLAAPSTGPASPDDTHGDSHHPISGEVPPHPGAQDLPPQYLEVFESFFAAFEPRATEVNAALRAFRHAEGRAVDIEERGHRALYRASQALFVILRRFWALRARAPLADALSKIEPRDLLLGGELAEVPTVALYAGAVPPRVLLWTRVAEDFVTLRIATFIGHVMTHLRYLLTFTLSAALLLVFAVSSYPLEPTRFVTVFSWTLMLAVIALAFVVIVRMERNEVLSRLSGSTPGRIDFNFALASQLVVYVGLPLLAVLANIFPEIRDQLFAWVGPVRRLLP